jgi:hypothetical protein
MANWKDYPMNRALRCGARNRAGHLCQAPALRNKRRCRLHGGWSPGAPRGDQHPNYRGGKYSKQTKELSKVMRELARAGEALLARTLDTHGLGRKLPPTLRRRTHIRRARAAAKARVKEGEKP